MEINRAILRNLFEDDYNVLEAENGDQAMMLVRECHTSLAAMLLDVVMPVKDGFQVMKDMMREGFLTTIPVIIITAENSTENEVRAFDLGATDIILKPFEPHVIKRRVQNAVELNRHKLHLEEMVEEQAVKLRESSEMLVDTLSSIIEHRSAETGQHVLRIRMFTKVLLQDVIHSYPEYDLDERNVSVISSAASLHDIGKIAIPDAILNKPGRLSEEEFEIMKTHSEKGCEILAGLDGMSDKDFLKYAYNICRYHHERWDGNGYPDHLKGDNIPIYAQAVGIADCYDALTTDRVYKKAISPEEAFTMILNGKCGCFSPNMLECLKNVRAQFVALAQNYADGNNFEADSEALKAKNLPNPIDNGSTLEFGQMKYFALLRYINCTVLEVDLNTGIYHMVYQQNNDFADLRSGNAFEKTLQTFIQRAVHPDDREDVLQYTTVYMKGFFDEGLMKRSRAYRILHASTGEYIQYEATTLRINTENPKQHRVLIVWKEAQDGSEQVQTLQSVDNAMTQSLRIGIQKCRLDNWFTIDSVNDGFLTLFGYSRQELQKTFENHFLAMIHPSDQAHVQRQVNEQYGKGSEMELEYRVIAKNGQIIWILDKCKVVKGNDGFEYIHCVLMDITQTKQAQEELRLTIERHQIIMDQSNDIIFEWDIENDRILFSSNWEEKFGYLPIQENIMKQIPIASHIFPEDISSFMNLSKEIAQGKAYGEMEIRIAKADGCYLWCRVRATSQYKKDKVVKAVGVILDIDEEKRKMQDFMKQAERDALTQLYNKSAARMKIQAMMEQKKTQGSGAMLIFDLDNFKLVNDLHGHMSGDALLSQIAAQLQGAFRAEDIVARIGGDEFLVYIQSLPNIKVLQDKVSAVLFDLEHNFSDELPDCHLSCSVGIAQFPQDGQNYQDVFQHCDMALYHAKLHGKNQYVIYDAKIMGKTFGVNTSQNLAASTRIDSDDIVDTSERDNYILQAFKLLYESGDVEQAIQAILEMVGKKYDVSRVYIFEDSEDGMYCNNTFEWCNQGIPPEIQTLQNVCYADLGKNYKGNFDENGIFYCRNIALLPKPLFEVLEPQGIYSLLQCAVRDEGRFVGYVGFDDCKEQRMWTKDQIEALMFISELLSTFLLKKRAQDRSISAAKNLRMVLDNQNSWIYVIDPDTYELHYINAKTASIAPEAKLGMCCYEAFFKRKEKCTQCPAQNIRLHKNKTMEVYNPLFRVWSLADASYIRWNNQDACLLSCHDITEYKKATFIQMMKENKTRGGKTMEENRTMIQSILVSTMDECFEVDGKLLNQDTLHSLLIEDLLTMWEKDEVQWLDLKACNGDTLKIIVDYFDPQKRCELTMMTQEENLQENVWYYCSKEDAAVYIAYFAKHGTILKGVELLETAHLY